MMDSLFRNHLAFMAARRGSVRYCRGDVHIEGPTAELTSFVPATDASTIPAASPGVRLAPWSGAGWPPRLEAAGYVRQTALNYMELANPYEPLVTSGHIEVWVVVSESDALAFARIQAAGFATGDSAVDDWWARYLPEQALLNCAEPDQTFYLGLAGDKPVTATLTPTRRAPGPRALSSQLFPHHS
jgi:hypothetical protein